MEEKIIQAIENIRPSLQNDGGDIQFLRLENKTVYVQLQGHCAGCEYSTMTVKFVVEKYLQDNIDKDIVVIAEM